MTVSSTTSRVSYAGNGSTTAFAVPFPFLASSDLVVIKVAGTTQTTLVLSTDYTVTGAGGVSGTVTCTVAPAAGSTLVIYRDPSITQLVDYQPNDPFPAATHETALDRLTMIGQRLKDLISRSFVLSDGDTSGASTTLPSPEANKLVGWNATATGLQNIDSSTLATLVAYGTGVADVFTGDGTTTVFTLTANPGAGPNLDVSVGGVTQIIGINYTWGGGTSITFTTAPGAGVKILARYMQGLPTSYSSPITITVSAGTAVLTGTDGTRSITLTPNTTNVLNSIGGGLNLSIGGTAALQIGTNRNVTVAAPASGVALSVTGFSTQPVAYFAGAASNAGYISVADGQAGTRVWSLISGAGAAGIFGIYDATAVAYRLKIATTGESTFLAGAATTSVAVTFSATAMTVNCQLSNVFATTFTANVTTAPSVSNPQDGQTINWFITQDATGSRTMTWPTSFKWPGGTAGVLSTAANSVDLLVATYRSATGFWYATLQKAFA